MTRPGKIVLMAALAALGAAAFVALERSELIGGPRTDDIWLPLTGNGQAEKPK